MSVVCTRLHELTVIGSKETLTPEQLTEWLPYFYLASGDPPYRCGVDLYQWIDFCLFNVEAVEQVRKSLKDGVVMGVRR